MVRLPAAELLSELLLLTETRNCETIEAGNGGIVVEIRESGYTAAERPPACESRSLLSSGFATASVFYRPVFHNHRKLRTLPR